MAISLNWKILDMVRESDGGVISVSFQCKAIDNNYVTHYGSAMTFTPDSSSSSYTQFTDLTESQVLDWVFTKLPEDTCQTKDEIETNLKTEIHKRKGLAGLPW